MQALQATLARWARIAELYFWRQWLKRESNWQAFKTQIENHRSTAEFATPVYVRRFRAPPPSQEPMKVYVG